MLSLLFPDKTNSKETWTKRTGEPKRKKTLICMRVETVLVILLIVNVYLNLDVPGIGRAGSNNQNQPNI